MLGAFILAVSAPALGSAYTWPAPQLDALEAARFDLPTTLSLGVDPCDSFLTASSGRANVADWVRTAYHDMATYNSEDGTGGLDGSIRFAEEQNRPENAGDGFANTMPFVALQASRYISIADSIALAAITAIESCGGPEIPFRGNRTDSTHPNSPGVPEPQQDLDAHIVSFKKQGFTKEEMIGLVAYTLSAASNAPFPDIVPEMNDPDNKESSQHFDSTFFTFDNNVAAEYISGTTQNPLVVGLNDTTNSDKRIFGSDGNVTMQGFADSQDLFFSTCSTLLARMLDTVPKETSLTDVITPLPVKPASVELQLDANKSTLKLSGLLRLWNTPADPTRSVRLLYADHTSANHEATNGNYTLFPANPPSSTSVGNKYTSSWYWYNRTASGGIGALDLDAEQGITSLSFVVDGKVEDQDGVGFMVEDGVVFSKSSCIKRDFKTVRFDVAVRNSASPTRVYLEQIQVHSPDAPSVIEIDIPRPSSVDADSVYSIWSIELPLSIVQYHIGAEFLGSGGAVKYSTAAVYTTSGSVSGGLCPE